MSSEDDTKTLLQEIITQQFPRTTNPMAGELRCAYCHHSWSVYGYGNWTATEKLKLERHSGNCLIAKIRTLLDENEAQS